MSISSPLLSVITSQNHTCCRCRGLTILVCYTYTLCLLLDQLLAFVFTLYNSACFDVCRTLLWCHWIFVRIGRCCQNNGLLTTRPKGSVHHFSNRSYFYSNPSPDSVWWCGYIWGMLLLVIICLKTTSCMCSVLTEYSILSSQNLTAWKICSRYFEVVILENMFSWLHMK